MSQSKLPTELQFRKGDTVKMVQLKTKKKWNGKLATIVGPYLKSKKRWPIEVHSDKSKALLQPKNLRIHKYGQSWVIDPNSPIQRLNLLLKSYTKDLEAFSKLTRKQKKIFHNDFIYEMHDNIIVKQLSGFDKQLNITKNTIIRLSQQNTNEKVEKFLIDETQVIVLDDTLKKFQISVKIKIGNNKIWERITETHLDQQTNLVKYAKLISINVIDDDKLNNNNKSNDNQINKDMQGIVNVFKNDNKNDDKDKNDVGNDIDDNKNDQNKDDQTPQDLTK